MPHSAGAGVWPLPALESPPEPTGASRRSWQRHGRAVAVTNVANSAIRSLNALSRSFYEVTPFMLHYSHQSHSATTTTVHSFEARNSSFTQSQFIARVYDSAARYVRRRAASAAECDDTSSDNEFSADISAYITRPKTPLVPIVSHRIALPAAPGAVDLLTLL